MGLPEKCGRDGHEGLVTMCAACERTTRKQLSDALLQVSELQKEVGAGKPYCASCGKDVDKHDCGTFMLAVRGPGFCGTCLGPIRWGKCWGCMERLNGELREENDQMRGVLANPSDKEREQAQLLSKCLDVFARFAGGPIIAHPPKCRFYIEGREKDCTCKAKDLMNDVLLTLKDLRAALGKQQPLKRICTCPKNEPEDHLADCPKRKDEEHECWVGDGICTGWESCPCWCHKLKV